MFAFTADFFNREKHLQALSAWCRTQGFGWVYVCKLLLGVSLAYWASMFLELSSTRSAALTVIIVMQPQTGQVFVKSIARIVGTVIGLAASLTFVNLFHQHPPLFLLATALWCSLCIAGAVRFRDFRAYVFLLAGYTVGMIGIPGAIDPHVAVAVSVSRMLAVALGIVCGGLVSATILPRTTNAAFQSLLARRLFNLCRHSSTLLHHQLSEKDYEQIRLQLAAQAVSTGALRQAASSENPKIRQHRQHLVELTHLFLDLSTRLHTMARSYFALNQDEITQTLLAKRFDDMSMPLVNLLDILQVDNKLSSHHVGQYLGALRQTRVKVRLQIRQARRLLEQEKAFQALDDARQQELQEHFETLSELLFRFTDQFYNYCHSYASLGDDKEHPKWHIEFDSLRRHFKPSVNSLYVLSCGARSVLVILIVSALWYYSGWSGGTMFVQNGIIGATLSATAANPHKMAVNLAQGSIVGYILGFSITFFLLPNIDGFALLILALSPIIIIGGWLTLNPKYAGIGTGAMINFCFVASPHNPAVFNPHQFVNDSIAGFTGMTLTAVLLALLFPPTGRWLSRAMIKDLRRLVAVAITAPLDNLKSRLDTQCCDILLQTYNVSSGQILVQRSLMDWHANVESVSHAIIELRALINAMPQEQERPQWRILINRMGIALTHLYLKPSARHHQAALTHINEVIQELEPQLEPLMDRFNQSPKRQMMSYLHFIRFALNDCQGPFRDYLVPQPAQSDITVEA
ncbi:FUSC family protein [Celerinatantimonas sp. YJH-8]|uniref:FUSC family protein n=1 Tax=Celerinatantimonas sp. YJH-8 TaxID=3228714 RepID=UPI0038C4F039